MGFWWVFSGERVKIVSGLIIKTVVNDKKKVIKINLKGCF